ncbi:RNA-directed DNA polymerase, eukaryota, nucleotide-binding alpha-beta plait domain protein [Tanacetum coccineum]
MAGYSYNEINSRRGRSSNEDLTQKISHSIFVTNFPVSVCSRDLWKVCSTYGTVVDVFIPSKLSKAEGEAIHSSTVSRIALAWFLRKWKKPEVSFSFPLAGRRIATKGRRIYLSNALEEMIKVGQTMGFNMEGCTLDMEKIIGLKE